VFVRHVSVGVVFVFEHHDGESGFSGGAAR
jgi:hypothetical protein